MFDLIDESGKELEKYGYTVKNLGKYGTTVASLVIESDEKSESLGMEKGEYFIISSPHIYDEIGAREDVTNLFYQKFEHIFNDFLGKKTLFVGLGNPDIWADCLGKCVIDEIYIDPLDKNNHIYKFCPNIFFSTGINTFDMVAILAQGLEIECVVVIDSLATNSIERLGKSIQISSAGMTPGSGVNKLGKRICKDAIGCPCFSIGVPFMIYSSSVKEGKDEMLLAPKDIHENVLIVAKIIGEALNRLL